MVVVVGAVNFVGEVNVVVVDRVGSFTRVVVESVVVDRVGSFNKVADSSVVGEINVVVESSLVGEINVVVESSLVGEVSVVVESRRVGEVNPESSLVGEVSVFVPSLVGEDNAVPFLRGLRPFPRARGSISSTLISCFSIFRVRIAPSGFKRTMVPGLIFAT